MFASLPSVRVCVCLKRVAAVQAETNTHARAVKVARLFRRWPLPLPPEMEVGLFSDYFQIIAPRRMVAAFTAARGHKALQLQRIEIVVSAG